MDNSVLRMLTNIYQALKMLQIYTTIVKAQFTSQIKQGSVGLCFVSVLTHCMTAAAIHHTLLTVPVHTSLLCSCGYVLYVLQGLKQSMSAPLTLVYNTSTAEYVFCVGLRDGLTVDTLTPKT